MQTMEQSLADLVIRGVVDRDLALSRSSKAEQLDALLIRAGMAVPDQANPIGGLRAAGAKWIPGRPSAAEGEKTSIWKKDIELPAQAEVGLGRRRRRRAQAIAQGAPCRRAARQDRGKAARSDARPRRSAQRARRRPMPSSRRATRRPRWRAASRRPRAGEAAKAAGREQPAKPPKERKPSRKERRAEAKERRGDAKRIETERTQVAAERTRAPKPSLGRKKRVVGLKIGSSQLAAAQVVNNGSADLVQIAREPLEHGIVVGGEPRRPGRARQRAAGFLQEAQAAEDSGVRLGIASNRIGVRTFEIAGIDDPKQLGNAIRFRAQEALPIPLEEAVLDYRVLSERVDATGQTVAASCSSSPTAT